MCRTSTDLRYWSLRNCRTLAFSPKIYSTVGARSLRTRGYLEKIVDDPMKLHNAILESARMDPPVPYASQVVDDDEGRTTEIGGRKLHFKKGNTIHIIFRVTNLRYLKRIGSSTLLYLILRTATSANSQPSIYG